MLRGIVGVIVGYLAMFVVVFLCLTAAYLIMGTERVFLPGSFVADMPWMIIMVIVSIIAAVIGGLVCAKVAGGSTAPKVLAVLVFVLGLLLAIGTMGDNKAAVPRTGELSNFEAMKNAKEPQWFSFANPLIGAIGVLAGAGLAKRRP
ncbi:MAG: hypothetical protein ABIP75_19945 [Pyrinomonadaceae bacterium]